RENPIASAGKDDHGCARVLSLRRVHGHRGPGDVGYVGPRSARDKVAVHWCGDLRSRKHLRVRRCSGPYRNLRMTGRWLPATRLGVQTLKRKYNVAEEDKAIHRVSLRVPSNIAAVIAKASRSRP